MGDTVGVSTACRSVTAEEIEHLHEHGWVKLEAFVDPDVLARVLDVAREQMGEDGDGNPLHPFVAAAVAEGGAGVRYFNAHSPGGLGNPVLRPVIEQVGTTAKSMLRRRSSDGSALGVRYYQDLLAPKLPASKASRHGGNGPTSFHQDFITFAVDRTGGMTFWIPLEEYGPEAGTMSFVDGSHRLGVMGDYTTYGDGDALTAFPELQDLEMSPPMNYELGDITVHTHLTIHGASENRTERPRWAWLVIVQPEDIRWNGSPCPNFDHRAMKPWQQMKGDRFPVIS
jgi:Phytanoyl-CoA dioxygenase (PhyH)